MKLLTKCNFPCAGRPLAYPIELDVELLKWIFVLSLESSRESKAFDTTNLSFNASRCWVRKFFNRHKLALRTRISISQKLSKQVAGVLSKSWEDATRFMRAGKYPLSLVGNMDKTPAFDTVPSKCIAKKDERVCVVCSSGSKKTHLTVVLSVTADGRMLPTMIIFNGKTKQTIRDLNIPLAFIVKTQKKAWMDDDLMKIWIEDILT